MGQGRTLWPSVHHMQQVPLAQSPLVTSAEPHHRQVSPVEEKAANSMAPTLALSR